MPYHFHDLKKNIAIIHLLDLWIKKTYASFVVHLALIKIWTHNISDEKHWLHRQL